VVVPSERRRWLSLDGLSYPGVPVTGVDDGGQDAATWIDILTNQTGSYRAQPWQHLADAFRSRGDEREAKAVLVAQQDDRRRRVVKAKRQRWRSAALVASKALTGYGYRTSLTLAWFAVLITLAAVMGIWAGHTTIANPARGAQTLVAAHGAKTDSPGSPCSSVELVGLGLEWSIPFVDVDASSTCAIDRLSPEGQRFTVASWAVQAGGWALATVVIAGFTGIVRRL